MGHVIDKLPQNFTLLGLIALMFPKAIIVHCSRHPLDIGVSCYFQPFNGRWQNYEKHLGPLKEALGDALRGHG